MSVTRHYYTCITLKGQYQHLSIFWTDILSSSYWIRIKFMCIHLYVYIFKYYFFKNKLPEIFPGSTQKVIQIDCTTREIALILLKNALDYFLCFSQ